VTLPDWDVVVRKFFQEKISKFRWRDVEVKKKRSNKNDDISTTTYSTDKIKDMRL